MTLHHTTIIERFPAQLFYAAVLGGASLASAATYHVATSGRDSHPGSLQHPFRTIQRAADVMQPGDSVLIRGGVYREKITPPRGGTSEKSRITYRAYPGETPVITGAERITIWEHQGGGVWKVEVPDAFFGTYNPYRQTFADAPATDWLHTRDVCPGEVFFDDHAFRQGSSLDEVRETPHRWFASHGSGITTIQASFGDANPNSGTAEITVRQQVFKPDQPGLGWITIDGLNFTKAATQWVEPGCYQDGLVSTFWGKSWVIQNCRISFAKTVGIVSGHTGLRARWAVPEMPLSDFGHHVVRNNLIEKCGEAGIAGMWGWVGSVIENNVIQDINYQNDISGIELACIKIHHAIDVTIRGNILRRIQKGPRKDSQSYGIWLDTEAQGSRITRNVIYDMPVESVVGSIFIECSQGPCLIDNNVIAAFRTKMNSSRVTTAHNLYVNSGHNFEQDKRVSRIYRPHSLEQIGRGPHTEHRGWRFFNDIYVGHSYDPAWDTTTYVPGNMADTRGGHNVYYANALPVGYDAGSVVRNDFQPNFHLTELPDGVVIRFRVDTAPFDVNCPLIHRDFIGVYSPMNQGIESSDGSPISLDHDLFGRPRDRARPVAGPFANLRPGDNTFVVRAGPAGPDAGDAASIRRGGTNPGR